MSHLDKNKIGFILGVCIPILIWFLPGLNSLPTEGRRALAIIVFAVIFWITEPIPLEITSLIMMLLFCTLNVVEPSVGFGGFTFSAIWLILAGFILSVGIIETGLGKRISNRIGNLFGNSYARSLIGLGLVGFLFSFLVPSGLARTAFITPIAISIARTLGLQPFSVGGAGLVLAAVGSTGFPGFGLLTAAIPNVVLMGAAEKVGINVYWSQFLKLHFLVGGVLKFFLILLMIFAYVFIKDKKLFSERRVSEDIKTGPMSSNEKTMGFYFLLVLILWAADSWHHINPAWVGLSVAILITFPGIGVIGFDDFRKKINFPILFYFAGALSIGLVLQKTGLSEWAGKYVLSHLALERMGHYSQAVTITGIGYILSLFMEVSSVNAILVPILSNYAVSHGMDAFSLIMMSVYGASASIFPYGFLPVIFAYGFQFFTMGQTIKFMLGMSFINIAIIVPITVLYWKLIGFL
jgi:anion transporter